MQPLGKPMDLDVRIGPDRRLGVGLAFDDTEAQEDMRSAYGTLSALVGEGLFKRRAEDVYRLEYHFRTEEDWQEFLDRPKADRVEADSVLLSSALAHPDGRIVAIERTTITVCDREG